jgi:hypothetical protein
LKFGSFKTLRLKFLTLYPFFGISKNIKMFRKKSQFLLIYQSAQLKLSSGQSSSQFSSAQLSSKAAQLSSSSSELEYRSALLKFRVFQLSSAHSSAQAQGN